MSITRGKSFERRLQLATWIGATVGGILAGLAVLIGEHLAHWSYITKLLVGH